MLKEIINVFSMSSCISMSVAMWAVGGQGYRLEDECAWKPVVSMGLTGVIGSFCHCQAFWLRKKMPVRELVPECQHVQTASYNLLSSELLLVSQRN